MAMKRTFAQRMGYWWTCVAPAILLSDDLDEDETPSLRQIASTDGLCYVSVLRPLCEGECYLARVAATPDLLHTQAFTVVLSEEDLRLTLAYDRRIEGKSTAHVLAMLHAHAQTLAPLSCVLPNETASTAPSASQEVAVFVLKPVSLPEPLVLSTAELQEVLQAVQPSLSPGTPQYTVLPSLNSMRVQQALLGMAIDTLMDRLFMMEQGAQALVLQARCTILASLQRWHRHTQQQVVTLVPCYEDAQRQPLWHLLIEGPVRLYVAAA